MPIKHLIINVLNSAFFLLFFSTTTLLANSPTIFEEANNAYQKGEFNTAIDKYEAILKTGEYSQELYYNLGNAYYKTNYIGKSILNYERALLVYPGDPDTQFNLEIAQQKVTDDLDRIGNFFLKEWWQNLHNFFSSWIWSILTIITLWAGIAGFLFWLLAAERKQKKQGFVGGTLLVLLSIFLFFITNSQANSEENSQLAIILSKEIELKNGPDKASTVVFKIHEGLKVKLLDQIGNWYKVKLLNGDQGWLPEGSFEEI